MTGVTLAQVITWAIGGAIALVTGGVGTAIVQGWLNRDTAKAEAARITAEEEKVRADAKKAEAERLALLAEVESKAYTAAKQLADSRYGDLANDYRRCRTGLDELRLATESLLDAIDAIMARAHPSNGHDVNITVTGTEISTVRSAVREARKHLN